MATRDIIFAAAGTAGEATYVEDVFSTYLYTGNDSTQTIINGIQLGDGSVIASQSSTALPTSTNRNYQFVAGGNGIYVAQAYLAGSPFASNYYATSTDGVTWTDQTSLPASYLWYGLAFGNGVFVMTTQYDASAEKAIYSSDGLNWSTASGYPSNYKSSGTYFINGEFFSVNNDINSFGQTIYRSSNGASWSSVSVNAGSSTQYLKMAYGAGIYILTGNANTVYSSNLSSWSINSVGLLFEIAYGNGKFVARTQSNALVTSTDGINWTTVQASGFTISNITFNGSLFLGSDSSGKIYWSSDGINWTSNSTISTTSLVNTTLSGKTVFIGTGNGARSAVVVDSFTPTSLGKGGLVWLKRRSSSRNNYLFDTTRGATKWLVSNQDTLQETVSGTLTDFNGDGFSLGSSINISGSGNTYASWTFRKAEKFFDVVTYTGNGDADRNITHNLGSVPGMIFIKKTSGTGNWAAAVSLSSTVYGIGGGGSGSGYELSLNLTDGYYDNPLKSTIATDTTVNVPRVYYNNASICNASGATYVMYLFASNAGGFGLTGTDNIISCGAFTTTSGGAVPTVTLGYEPQFLMFKCASAAGNWNIIDNMRGFSQTQSLALFPNASSAETNYGIIAKPTATGFTSGDGVLAGSQIFTYMAIRRGPMKRPTSGTSVFQPVRYAGNNASGRVISTGKTFPTDWLLTFDTENGASGSGTSYNSPDITRLAGFGVNPPYLRTNSTIAEQSAVNTITLNNSNFDYTVGATSGQLNSTGANYTNWNIGRAPGFFDVVCYTGTGTATNYTHNLGVVPELYIIKRRSASASWIVGGTVFPSATANYIPLEDIGLQTQSNTWQTPTATTFGIGTAFQSDNTFNASGSTYIAYLFATLAGVSKVGSYTGTGSTQTINAGLPTGARFVLIKRTDSVGDWWAWDTATGMVAGNDTRIAINLTAQIVNQNWVYTVTNGFQIVTADASVNANGGTYIYLAIA